MSSSADDAIRNVEKWQKLKAEISELEKSAKKYRERIEKYMDEKDTNRLDIGKYTVKRTQQSRDILSKEAVPNDIWEKYRKTSKFFVYTVQEKK